MTFIQPHKKKNTLDTILFTMVGVVILATFWLVMSYNKVVNLNHGISDAKLMMNKVQSESADFKNRAFALLDGNYLLSFAKEKNLVQEKNPRYFEVNSQWQDTLFASHY